MKIAQISLFALSSIDAQPAGISISPAAPFNYDDEYTSYDDDHTLDERKVPNRHPKARLRTLEAFSYELLDTWFDHIPSQDNWKMKFATNIQRMRSAFDRCGFFDASLPHGGPEEKTDENLRLDNQNPRVGAKQLTTGLSKWAQRYLNNCNGQRKNNHQENRMKKWNKLLNRHLNAIGMPF